MVFCPDETRYWSLMVILAEHYSRLGDVMDSKEKARESIVMLPETLLYVV